MAYEQQLYSIVKDYIKPQAIKKKNRYAKWVYGYDKEYDVIVINKELNVNQNRIIKGYYDHFIKFGQFPVNCHCRLNCPLWCIFQSNRSSK